MTHWHSPALLKIFHFERVNICPFQGSRTIRTEEAVMIGLSKLGPLLASNVPVSDVTQMAHTKPNDDIELNDGGVSDETSESEWNNGWVSDKTSEREILKPRSIELARIACSVFYHSRGL